VAVARAPTAATQQAASNGASSTPAGAMSEGEAEAAWARTEAMLKAAGASVVVRDEGSVKVRVSRGAEGGGGNRGGGRALGAVLPERAELCQG